MVPGLDLPTPTIINRLTPFWLDITKLLLHILLMVLQMVFIFILKALEKASFTPNLLSAHEHPEAVDSKLLKEPAVHRLAGPFVQPTFSKFSNFAFRICPKKGSW